MLGEPMTRRHLLLKDETVGGFGSRVLVHAGKGNRRGPSLALGTKREKKEIEMELAGLKLCTFLPAASDPTPAPKGF